MNSIPQKQCSRCGEYKPQTREYFYGLKSTPDGLYYHCKECHKKRLNERWIPKKPPKETVRDGNYRCPHCLSELPLISEFFHSNSKSSNGFASWCRKCTNTNQGIFPRKRLYRPATERAKAARRAKTKTPEGRTIRQAGRSKQRAKKTNAIGTHTASDLLLQYQSQNGKCWHCGKDVGITEFQTDHLIPLSRGGSNAPGNIVVSCGHCNSSKNNRLPHEWNGKLL